MEYSFFSSFIRRINKVVFPLPGEANDCGVVLGELVVRQDLAEGVHFAHATAYQLGRLRAEVQNDNLLLHNL